MNLLQKFKETMASVLPIMLIVLVLGLTAAPLGTGIIVRFLIGGILLILGLTVFLLGVDIGIIPIGERSGAALTAKRNLPLMLAVSFAIGFIVTIAEPDVQVLAGQIKSVAPVVNKWILVLMIAVGVGLFVMLGLLRTIISFPLKIGLIVFYILLFVLAFLSPEEFQGVAFDSGGATTGPMTVPFIMALGVGVAAVRTAGRKKTDAKEKKTLIEKAGLSAEEEKTQSADDSFGLTGIASIGPVAAVCIYGIILRLNGGLSSEGGNAVQVAVNAEAAVDSGLHLSVFLELFPSICKEVALAMAPLVVLFVFLQLFLLKLPPIQVRRLIKGQIYAFAGLVLFLTGVNGGFMPAGNKLGAILGGFASGQGGFWIFLLIATGFVFGAVVVCAEPAVWVLTEQVENVSGGTIKRKVMLTALSCGVALSIGISMLRVLYGFNLWYVLIPGYFISLVLTVFCPKLFVGIAYDSGGVASGPMTSTFILSFTLGASGAAGGNPVTDGFGVIALVAMTPLLAIQILGLIYNLKNKQSEKKRKQEVIQ